jgi:hypothetical protein
MAAQGGAGGGGGAPGGGQVPLPRIFAKVAAEICSPCSSRSSS